MAVVDETDEVGPAVTIDVGRDQGLRSIRPISDGRGEAQELAVFEHIELRPKASALPCAPRRVAFALCRSSALIARKTVA